MDNHKFHEKNLNSADKEILKAFDRWKNKNSNNLKNNSILEHKERRLKAKLEKQEQDQKLKNDLLAFACSSSKEKFFNSTEWKKLRFNALQKYGNKCCSCGASAQSGAVLHVDHIKPRSIYPEYALDIQNLQILCADCNLGKGTQSTKIVIRRPSQKLSV